MVISVVGKVVVSSAMSVVVLIIRVLVSWSTSSAVEATSAVIIVNARDVRCVVSVVGGLNVNTKGDGVVGWAKVVGTRCAISGTKIVVVSTVVGGGVVV